VISCVQIHYIKYEGSGEVGRRWDTDGFRGRMGRAEGKEKNALYLYYVCCSASFLVVIIVNGISHIVDD